MNTSSNDDPDGNSTANKTHIESHRTTLESQKTSLEVQKTSLSTQTSTTLEAENQQSTRFAVNVPDSLQQRYHILEHLHATGAESDIFLVRARDNNQEYVLKLYRRNRRPNKDVWRLMSTFDPDHVVELYECGITPANDHELAYEILEYASKGNLLDLIDAEGGKLSDSTMSELIAELASAAEHIHQHKVIHKDLKPDNILVRTTSPLDVMLVDFGISSILEGTSAATSLSMTEAYAPPEAHSAGMKSEGWDYWSIGMILLKALTGKNPFDGFSQMAIKSSLATKPVPVESELENRPTYINLCRGLLTRDRDYRWGKEELTKWISGDRDIPVQDSEFSGLSAAQFRSYPLGSEEHQSLESIARHFVANWTDGKRELKGVGLMGWVLNDLRDYESHRALEEIRALGKSDDEKVFRFILKFATSLPPIWKGHALNAEGLKNLSGLALSENKNKDLLEEILNQNILKISEEIGENKSNVKNLGEIQDWMLSSHKAVTEMCMKAKSAKSHPWKGSTFKRRDLTPYITQLRYSKDKLDTSISSLKSYSGPALEVPWYKTVHELLIRGKDISHIEAASFFLISTKKEAVSAGEAILAQRAKDKRSQENKSKWLARKRSIITLSFLNAIPVALIFYWTRRLSKPDIGLSSPSNYESVKGNLISGNWSSLAYLGLFCLAFLCVLIYYRFAKAAYKSVLEKL